MQDGAETAEDDGRLERVKTITQTARATWFGYLGALAFTGVTLLGVEDADFFARNSATELPLIGIAVPVTYFFGAGALLMTVVFVYLHVFLEQLWHALGRAPARVKGEPLAAHAHPWLVSEMALNARRRLRGAEGADEAGTPLYCVETSPLGRLGVLASGLLLYAAGPALLAGLWVRSMPAHDAWMTGAIGGLLGISLWSAWASLGALGDKLRGPAEAPAPRSRGPVSPAPARDGVMLVGLVALVGVSVMRTEWDWRDYRTRPGGTDVVDGEEVEVPEDTWTRFRHWFRPVPADLAEVRLTALPGDWLSRDDAEKEFYSDWCARPDTADCETTIPQDGPFQQEWQARRETYLDVQPKPVLAGRDLSFADLSRAFLPGIDLRGAVLKRADLSGAQMEGANLRDAQMQGAELHLARMEGANLRDVRMEGARLWEAQMQGASLRGARMEGTDLRDAQMQKADLSWARMEGSDLMWAHMEGADLSGARMQGTDLLQARLLGADLGRARLQGATLRWTWMQGADLREARMEGADLMGARMQGADLREARMQGTFLITAQIEGADLREARMQGANLSYSLLVGAAGTPIPLSLTNLSAAMNHGGALRFADLSDAATDLRTDFRNSFGDGSVTLPAGIVRPCQWAGEVLDEAAFMARWRGWVEAGGEISWGDIAAKDYETISPVPPPESCDWKTGPLPTGP